MMSFLSLFAWKRWKVIEERDIMDFLVIDYENRTYFFDFAGYYRYLEQVEISREKEYEKSRK